MVRLAQPKTGSLSIHEYLIRYTVMPSPRPLNTAKIQNTLIDRDPQKGEDSRVRALGAVLSADNQICWSTVVI